MVPFNQRPTTTKGTHLGQELRISFDPSIRIGVAAAAAAAAADYFVRRRCWSRLHHLLHHLGIVVGHLGGHGHQFGDLRFARLRHVRLVVVGGGRTLRHRRRHLIAGLGLIVIEQLLAKCDTR